jgi:hypothetical protein
MGGEPLMRRGTANLQGLTVKQAAAMMNVSERTIYTGRTVWRRAPHLERPIMAGTMFLNEAYRLATNKAKPTAPPATYGSRASITRYIV